MVGAPCEVDASGLPPAVLQALDEPLVGAAPVVRIEGHTATQHRLLPMPGCWCAGAVRPGSCEATALLDPLLGIAAPGRITGALADPGMALWTTSGDVRVPCGERATRARGAGATEAAAAVAFLGEAIERYAAFRPDPADLEVAAVRDVAGGAATILDFAGYDAAQRTGTDYVEPGDAAVLGWRHGRRLADGAIRAVPAAAVYLRRCPADEPRFAPLHSIGLAAHTSYRLAADHARLEVLERWATSRAWHRHEAGAALPATVLDETGRSLGQRLMGLGRTFWLGLVSAPAAVPVVTAVVHGTSFPWVAFGSAARRTVAAAARAALTEASMLFDQPPASADEPGALAKVSAPRHHLLWHATAAQSEAWRRVLAGAPRALAIDPDRTCTDTMVLAELLAVAPDAIEVELTPPDIAACGFHVVKTCAPGVPFLSFGSLGAPARHLARHGLVPRDGVHPFA